MSATTLDLRGAEVADWEFKILNLFSVLRAGESFTVICDYDIQPLVDRYNVGADNSITSSCVESGSGSWKIVIKRVHEHRRN